MTSKLLAPNHDSALDSDLFLNQCIGQKLVLSARRQFHASAEQAGAASRIWEALTGVTRGDIVIDRLAVVASWTAVGTCKGNAPTLPKSDVGALRATAFGLGLGLGLSLGLWLALWLAL